MRPLITLTIDNSHVVIAILHKKGLNKKNYVVEFIYYPVGECCIMYNFTINDALNACGGKLCGTADLNTPLGSVVIDSRAVRPGDLFVAYKGEKADGHDYIKTALDNGAACCLAQRVPDGETRGVIVTADVQAALETITAAMRSNINIPVVGITGSVGKTTTKEMVWAVLSQRLNVLKTDGNLNNQIGVPMTLSRITPQHEAAVVEMGISGFGEMSVLASMARPTVAIFTVIGHAHLEFLHNLDGVFQAKTEMINFMPDDGTVIINGDDEKLRQLKCRQKIISCGFGENCDVRAENVRYDGESGSACDIIYGARRLHAEIPAYGQHMIYAALEGAAAGFALGLSDEEIAAGIAQYHTVGRRGVVTETGSITLVDDCYNANPDSMRCAIDSLVKLPGRHVCVLSDMREMGEESPEMHRDLGLYAMEKGIDFALTYGAMSSYIAQAMGEKAMHFETREDLMAALPEYIKKGDNVLVKASFGMHLEPVAEMLKTLEL